jgi:hypothetical protein
MAEVQEKTEFQFPDEAEPKPEEKPQEQPLEVTDKDEGDVSVEIIDDVPEEDRVRRVGQGARYIPDVTDDELATHTANVQKRLKELSFARHDERRAKEVALRERQEAERMTQSVWEENKRLKEYVGVGEKAYQGTAKAAATAKLEMAKQKYKTAHEAFDADALVAAQQELTAAQLELVAAENFRPMQMQPVGQAAQTSVYAQSTEQVQPDPKVTGWQQRNRWFGVNRPMTAYALGLHQELVESGVDPRTDEYFKRLDADLRQTFPKAFAATNGEEPSSASQPHRKVAANVVAPTSRSSSAKKITLTQTQVNLAKKLGVTNEEYAKHVALLETQHGR